MKRGISQLWKALVSHVKSRALWRFSGFILLRLLIQRLDRTMMTVRLRSQFT